MSKSEYEQQQQLNTSSVLFDNKNFQQQHQQSLKTLGLRNKSQIVLSHKIKYKITILIIVIIIQMILILVLFYQYETISTSNIKNNSLENQKNIVEKQRLSNQQQKIRTISQQIIQKFLQYQNDYQQNCPNGSGLFHVHVRGDKKMQIIPTILQKRAKKCQIPIYQANHFIELISKWNNRYPENLIKLAKITSHDHKMLLIFLQLYYYGGTYVDQSQILSKIHNRCWKLAIIDFDILFASTKEILENGVILPNFQKFIRVKYPYTPMIKDMILKIIQQRNYDQQCRQRQCIIVQCLEGITKEKQQLKSQKERRELPLMLDSRKAMQKYNQIVPQNSQFDQKVEYNIYSYLSVTSCLDVNQISYPFNMIIYKCFNTSNQRFKFLRSGQNTYKVKSVRNMNQTMKISEGTRNIIFGKETQSSDQFWQFTLVTNLQFHQENDLKNAYFVQSKNSGLSMNLPQSITVDQNQIIAFDFNKYANQIWIIVPAYRKQLQFQTFDDYAQNLVNLLTYRNNHNKKLQVQYIRTKIRTMNKIQPTWMNHIVIPQEKDLPIQNWAALQKVQRTVQFPKSIFFQCAKNHTITYMWFGTKQMPLQYQQILTKCKDNVKLLNQKDCQLYIEKWNSYVEDDRHKVDSTKLSIRSKLDLFKLIYLFFESGIYSDFDTQINQKCFQNVYADEIIWTNFIWWGNQNHLVVPEQNFIVVKDKFNPQVKKMILAQLKIGEGSRWDQCRTRQCFILNCQRHYQDRTYKKGYD